MKETERRLSASFTRPGGKAIAQIALDKLNPSTQYGYYVCQHDNTNVLLMQHCLMLVVTWAKMEGGRAR